MEGKQSERQVARQLSGRVLAQGLRSPRFKYLPRHPVVEVSSSLTSSCSCSHQHHATEVRYIGSEMHSRNKRNKREQENYNSGDHKREGQLVYSHMTGINGVKKDKSILCITQITFFAIEILFSRKQRKPKRRWIILCLSLCHFGLPICVT